MNMKGVVLMVLGSLLGVTACRPTVAKDFVLVGPDGVAATVVIPENADESTKLAATELTNYVAKITGVILEVKKVGVESRCRCRTDAPSVFIGTLASLGDAVPAAIAKRLNATDNPEAGCVATDGKTLWIVGKEDVSELYATYHFIEDKLGVRWFKAATKDDPGEYVPTSATILLKPFAEMREPRFRIRRLDKASAFWNAVGPNSERCAVRNGYQVYPAYNIRGKKPTYGPGTEQYAFYAPRVPKREVNLGGGHGTFYVPIPAKKYFKDHPEYFALVDGVRQEKTEQYCFSHPDVRRLTAEHILKGLDANDGKGTFLFGNTDVTHGWCECELCKKLDPPAKPGESAPNVSTRFNLAVSNIAEMVWAKYPKADLHLWAYHTYRKLPIGVRQDPRMVIHFCDHSRCYGHRINDPSCDRNVEMLDMMKGWLAISPKMYTYEYFTCTPAWYVCQEKVEAADLRYYASLGIIGWKNEAVFSDSHLVPEIKDDPRRENLPSNWQWLYTTGKLLWNPDLDEDAILEDAESKYYGEAYPAMKKYHALRRRLWVNNPACMGYPWKDSRRPTLLNVAGAKDELLGYLDEADKLVDAASCRVREKENRPFQTRRDAASTAVLKHRLSLDRKWLTKYWIEPNEELRKKAGKAFNAPRASTPVVLDGKADEGAWSGAYYFSGFLSVPEKKAIPSDRATSVGILQDDDGFAFLVKAKGVSAKDAFEFVLHPPSIDNITYTFTVDARGRVSAKTDRRGTEADAFKAQAAAVLTDGELTLELKVPTARIHPVQAGETWTAFFRRSGASGTWSSEGTDGSDASVFRPLELGRPYLYNGSFVDVNAKGEPACWCVNGKETKVVPAGSGHVVLLKGMIFQSMERGALAQCARPRKLRYSVRAKGPGKLDVSFFRYQDTDDPKSKVGYRRRNIYPGGKGGTYEVSAEGGVYTGAYTVEPGEWVSIVLGSKDGVQIESVSVFPQE